MFKGYTAELKGDLGIRWRRVQTAVREAGADGLLANSNINIFYLTGRIFMGYMYLPAEGDPLFFVRRPCGLTGDGVAEIRKPEQIPGLMTDCGITLPDKLMLEGDDLAFSEWRRLETCFAGKEMADGSALLRRARAVKTPYEVGLMKETGARHAKVIARFPDVYERGMTDQQWTVAMCRLMLEAGSLGLFRVAGRSMEAFMGTVLAGDNGAAVSPYDFALGGAGMHSSLPVGQCGVVLEGGMSVMADVCANFYGYLTDCTRTFAVGHLAADAVMAHQVSIEITQTMTAAAKPGVRCDELYALALGMAEKAGLADCFMGTVQKAQFVGHGTGIVINELPVIGPRSKDLLETGMCLALEPKFVIEGTGAVGIEDTVLVSDAGGVNLTPCDPALVSVG